eukprot:543241-Rhodomonas_salina.2
MIQPARHDPASVKTCGCDDFHEVVRSQQDGVRPHQSFFLNLSNCDGIWYVFSAPAPLAPKSY